MCKRLSEELALCTSADAATFERIKTEPRKISFHRGTFAEDVFVVAQTEKKVIIFDDIEDGFEVGTLDLDGVLRNAGASQFDLPQALNRITKK